MSYSQRSWDDDSFFERHPLLSSMAATGASLVAVKAAPLGLEIPGILLGFAGLKLIGRRRGLSTGAGLSSLALAVGLCVAPFALTPLNRGNAYNNVVNDLRDQPVGSRVVRRFDKVPVFSWKIEKGGDAVDLSLTKREGSCVSVRSAGESDDDDYCPKGAQRPIDYQFAMELPKRPGRPLFSFPLP